MVDNLIIGTQGWESETWLESFYPEGLPEDWRLDFYSNFFECVLVPEPVWQAWTEEALEDLNEMLEGEEFWFFFEVTNVLSSQDVQQLEMIRKELQNRAAGIVFKEVNQVLPESLNEYTMTLVSKTDKLDGWCWQYQDTYVSGEPVGYIDTLSAEGKVQSEMLKQFMQSLPGNKKGVPFLVGSDQVDIDQVKNLKIIGEIMGY